MNTYSKYAPNVFLAKCTEKHSKGDIINVTTKYGKENESVVHNLIYEKDNHFYYSITRADGFNIQERAKNKSEKYENWASIAEKKSTDHYKRSQDLVKHIPMGQPILVGHHSETGHRRTLDRSWSAMGKSVEFSDKASAHESKADYWAKRANDINLSMPESIEFYEYKLEAAKIQHEGLKNGSIKREHGYQLTYAKKAVNEAQKNLDLAKKLWS
ncbi:DUF3560 domain-containing protein [Chryseobacterium sp. G0240]|uniref:DUF3560 domain-containing protein n=1 Tax=Chryseobacterium sp. G0240 TaxID=2487066 RepID=UPI000F44D384|nr:DUF3560 domain-containing protein [Chryseobacterium sp. G0240]ROI05470.1 DUF3560 domain-containing protein [Chryseobacterium sp. G0240]